MSEYHRARVRMRRRIQDAYWSFYERGEQSGCTVGEICLKAGIHRSTFYNYYSCGEDVLESIETEQMGKLKDLFARTDRDNIDYTEFIPGFQRLFEENRKFLVPLVLEYRDYAYAKEYRSYMNERMMEDLKIEYDRDDPVASSVIEVMVSGLNDMFLKSLNTGTVTLEQSNALSYGMMTIGLTSVLERHFGIKVGFRRMV